MIFIDFLNFIYCRHDDINEKIINNTLNTLNIFGKNNNTILYIVFDGVSFKKYNLKNYSFCCLIYALPDADYYIISHVKKYSCHHTYIVTNDREIKNNTKHYIKQCYNTREFWNKCERSFIDKNNNDIKTPINKNSKTTKITDYYDIDLDELMKKS